MKDYAIILDANVLIDFIEEENIDKFGNFHKLVILPYIPPISLYLIDIVKEEWDSVKKVNLSVFKNQ